ncbi:hypothetical protein AQ490_15440 [Wenjunlia vitaminophila]|uniref:Uncharacterized protein n=1 Tax=Wenjunlia vitaminophila TaxID=76728 RepID=A0A0T6LWM8_WENVI|nr:hypothetical protein [Wenjunlia vitaminophila]KRV50474.1 hypothetical protein AQ490_15440 [Wenjunlia vitaminophila]
MEATDYRLTGAGPPGLRLGYPRQRAGRPYPAPEEGPGPGAPFHRTPRHRRPLPVTPPPTGTGAQGPNPRTDWDSSLSAAGPRAV